MLVACITGFINYNFWYSYILFLVIVGGILVLFIYMTRIASNEKFKYSNKILIIVIIIRAIYITIYLLADRFIYYQGIISTETIPLEQIKNWKLSLNKYINYPTNLILIRLIRYLFITLIAIVKITNVSYGPLRQKF